jgi:undecaprenyl-diphosphatase
LFAPQAVTRLLSLAKPLPFRVSFGMPDWIGVIILGIIEGITEFLPVSSTGHLLLAEHWLGARSELFNVVIQTGAVVAVLAVFAARAKSLLLDWRQPANRDYLAKLAVAFVLTAIGGLALKHAGLKLPKEVSPVAWATLVGGVLFVLVEWWLRDRKTTENITWTVAIAVGIAQLVAVVFPGASRSGTTILIALVLGLSRSSAAEFSFLLGIPTLLAAGAKETLDAVKGHEAHEPWSQILLGTVVAAIMAFLVVKWLLGYIRHHTFIPFGWYRIAVGLAILLLL